MFVLWLAGWGFILWLLDKFLHRHDKPYVGNETVEAENEAENENKKQSIKQVMTEENFLEYDDWSV